MAIHLWMSLFPAAACLGDEFEARWAVSKVAFQWTAMAARKSLPLAWALTRGLHLTTFDWWVYFCISTWTEERLTRVNSASLAESQMAEVVAGVETTGERLVALLEANMVALRVSSAFLD